jgi:predicted nucleotidyltransferase
MDASVPRHLARLVARAEKDPEVFAVLLFGSRARGEASADSDADVCLVLAGEPGSDLERAQKRLDYLAYSDLDVAVFQSLPLHIRSRILREGQVLFVCDEGALYAVAFRTARAWEGFRHIPLQYLDQVLHG